MHMYMHLCTHVRLNTQLVPVYKDMCVRVRLHTHMHSHLAAPSPHADLIFGSARITSQARIMQEQTCVSIFPFLVALGMTVYRYTA